MRKSDLVLVDSCKLFVEDRVKTFFETDLIAEFSGCGRIILSA